MVPGIHVITLESTVGPAYTRRDPINLSLNQEYSDVRKDKSGSTVYDPVDFGLYNNAMCDIYSYVVWLQRAYGTLWMFDRDNAYMPEALLAAQNIDYDSLKNNMTDFRTGLNELIGAVSAYKVPAIYPVFSYKTFAYKYYYSEGTSVKDQLYMYTPGSFLQMYEDPDGSWGLKSIQINTPVNRKDGTQPAGPFTYDQLLEIGWNMLSEILGNSDVVTMTGDIKTRYGSDVLSLAAIPEQFRSEIIFDIGTLEQMKNAQCVYQPGICLTDFYSVNQSANKSILESSISVNAVKTDFNKGVDVFGNAITADLISTAGAILQRYYGRDKFLTTTTYAAGSDLVLDSSRMMVANIPEQSTSTVVDLYFGSLVPSFFSVIEINLDGSVGRFDYSNMVYIADTTVTAAFTTALNTVGNLSNFRFHPETEYIYWSSTDDAAKETNPVFDVDNYTIMTPVDITRIHRASLLAEYGVNGIK